MRFTFTSHFIKLALCLAFLSSLMIGQQQAPPDVYTKWMATGKTITLGTGMAIPLPTSGVTKYNFHYVYMFFRGSCIASDINTVVGTISGVFPNSPSSDGVPIGSVLNPQQPGQPGAFGQVANAPPVIVLKGNGAVNSLSAYVVIGGTWSGSPCTLDVLYKGTIKEEEGATPAGVLVPAYTVASNEGLTPTTSTSGAMTTYTYNIATANTNGFAIYSVTWCVLPISTTGAFRATTPVVVGASTNSTQMLHLSNGTGSLLGKYAVTNGCYTIGSPTGVSALAILNGYGTDGTQGKITITYTFPTAAAYPTSTELVATVLLKSIY